MIRREFLIDTHITMEYDDMSCVIEENEQETHCFNPISGINHLIYCDDGDDEDCPWVPTRRKLIRGQVLTSSSGQAFIYLFIIITSTMLDSQGIFSVEILIH